MAMSLHLRILLGLMKDTQITQDTYDNLKDFGWGLWVTYINQVGSEFCDGEAKMIVQYQ